MSNKHILIEIKNGPSKNDDNDPLLCFKCRQPFLTGQDWTKHWDEDYRYAIGFHNPKCAPKKSK